MTGSYIVVGRIPLLFAGNRIYSVCYLDDRDPESSSLLCVSSPVGAIGGALDVRRGPGRQLRRQAGRSAVGAGAELGDTCVWVGGATTVVGGRRLNYGCANGRVLFGSPDTSRSTWRIRVARDGEGHGMRKVAIRAAWR